MNQNMHKWSNLQRCLLLLMAFGWQQNLAGMTLVDIIPRPHSVELGVGELRITSATTIFYATRSAPRSIETTLQPLAMILAEDIELITGIRPRIVDMAKGTPELGDIVLEFGAVTGEFAETEAEEDQAYTLNVTDRITISSQYYKGVAYGSASLIQSIDNSTEISTVPIMKVRDRPTMAYRTLMLDIARQPHTLNTLRETIDLSRLYKVRYLQLHLTDDQGFVFPFEPVIEGLTKNKIKNHSYTRQEIQDLVAYADARGITLVPEFDLPGHSKKLRQSGFVIDDPKIDGFGDADVASPINYPKVEAIIDDMLNVFESSPYFHIGGDESAAGSRLEPFLGHVNKYLRSKPPKQRKRMLVWEGFRGAPIDELPATGEDRVIVLAWEGGVYNAPWNLLNNGYTVVNASWKPLYVVGGGAARLQHYSTRRWPAKVIYSWDSDSFMHWQPGVPVYEDRGPDDQDRTDSTWRASYIGREDQVIGGQLLFWEQSENIVMRDLVERLPAFSDRLWNPESDATFDEFKKKQDALYSRAMTLVRPIEISPNSIDPTSPASLDYTIYQGDRVNLTLRNRSRMKGSIRYELAGVRRQIGNFQADTIDAVDANSNAYTGPFDVVKDGFVVRAGLFRNDGSPVRGQSYRIYNNFPQTVLYTSYERTRDEFPSSKREFPDFEQFIGKRKVIETAETPWLRGAWTHADRGLQRLDTVWRVKTGGTYKFESKADSGRATTYIDLNQNGKWEADEKLVSTLSGEKYSSVDIELEPGDYRVRIDHVTELFRPVLTTAIAGPDTGGQRKDMSLYLVPLEEHGIDLTPSK